jgi:hypothetical protein
MSRERFEILFEFRQVGAYVKVSAVDPVTNTEVAIVGSARMSKDTLKANALRKLRYVLAKNRKGDTRDG